MRVPLFLIAVFLSSLCHAQVLNTQIQKASFSREYSQPPAHRSLLKFNKKSDRYNPLMYFGAAFLLVYQRVFSEQFQAECVYETSCSEYTKISIQKKGFVRGMLAGFSQVTECFRGELYEQPPIYIRKGKIINSDARLTD